MNNTDNPVQPMSINQTPPMQTVPENQPVGIPSVEKKFSPILVFVIIFVMSIVAVGAFYLGTKQNKPAPQSTQNQPVQQTESEPTPTNPVTSPSQTIDLIPQENSLYFGSYQDKDVLFITDKEKQVYYEGGEQKTSVYIGELATIGGGGYKPFDFKKLSSPKRILTNSTKPIFSINSFIVNKSKTIVYVSVNYTKAGSQYPDMLNSVLQINTNGSSAKEIWSNDIGSNKYSKGKGATYLEQVANDKYITFNIADCYACSGSPVGTIILNITTKNEKYFEMIGDVQLNLETNTFSYKKLSPFQEQCEPSPGCDNGQRTVMKTAGQTLTDNLP